MSRGRKRRRGGIESPCVNICSIDPKTRICMGCWRSLDEIAGWSGMSPKARRAVMVTLPARAARLAPGVQAED